MGVLPQQQIVSPFVSCFTQSWPLEGETASATNAAWTWLLGSHSSRDDLLQSGISTSFAVLSIHWLLMLLPHHAASHLTMLATQEPTHWSPFSQLHLHGHTAAQQLVPFVWDNVFLPMPFCLHGAVVICTLCQCRLSSLLCLLPSVPHHPICSIPCCAAAAAHLNSI